MELAFGSTGEAYRRVVLDDRVVERLAAGSQRTRRYCWCNAPGDQRSADITGMNF